RANEALLLLDDRWATARNLPETGEYTAWLIEPRTGRALTPLFRHAGSIKSLTVSFDGRRLVSWGADRSARFWDVSADDRPVAAVVRVAGLRSGRRMDAAGDIRLRGSDDWRPRWQELRARYPRSFARGGAEEALAWHRHEAAVCGAAGKWFAAAWHLD